MKSETVVDSGLTLYDMNKQIMKNIDPLNELQIASAQSSIEDWFNMSIDCYAMLLCNERRDFTLFHLYENQNPNPCKVAANEFIGCLIDRGDILSIEPADGNAWEVWIKIDDEPYCYYLFNYDNGVIEC